MTTRKFLLVADEYRKHPNVEIKLPVRGTKGSAGYDMFSPVDLEIPPGTVGKFFTDVRASMGQDEFLWMTPRSSTGNLFLMIPQTAGIIDSDYIDNPQTGGNILVKLFNFGTETQYIKAGERLVQGIFQTYLTTHDDTASGSRVGGYGSTGK